jgi:hypothetical protein
MKNILLLSALALGAVASPAFSAVSVTTANGDGGTPVGYTLIYDFETALPGGALTGNGAVVQAPGVPNQSAAPAGTPAGEHYLTVPQPNDQGQSTGTATLQLGGQFNKVSFYWGSIDTYNSVELLDGMGNVIGSAISGGGLPAPTLPNGNQAAPTSNRRVFIVNDTMNISALRFSSQGFAFELDNVAAAVPEPASWAMMLGGFGMLGFAARRRQVARTVLA